VSLVSLNSRNALSSSCLSSLLSIVARRCLWPSLGTVVITTGAASKLKPWFSTETEAPSIALSFPSLWCLSLRSSVPGAADRFEPSAL